MAKRKTQLEKLSKYLRTVTHHNDTMSFAAEDYVLMYEGALVSRIESGSFYVEAIHDMYDEVDLEEQGHLIEVFKKLKR